MNFSADEQRNPEVRAPISNFQSSIFSRTSPGNSNPVIFVILSTMPKKKDKETPKVHEDLEGFELGINEFGEITSSFNVEKLNKFLNKEVDDKKLRDRDDLDFIKDKKKGSGESDDSNI